MSKNEFIPRKFKDIETNEIVDFETVVKSSNISVILGEPASGKTYQLENYKKSSNSIFVELMFIDEEEDINDTTKIVLLDSIDEALSKNDSDKALARKLIKYIQKCQQINPNIKFVISCRYIEWKEIFVDKLKDVDKDLKVYSIEELNKEDINLLLIKNNINKNEFWDFIQKHYLEQLLKNILMTLHIINNFNSYKNKQLKYFEIYKKIIEEHLLAETDNERKNQLKEVSLEDMIKISSIVATYMTLNRTRTISIENINKFANELYSLEGVEITGKKLEIIFDTALFSGNRQNIRFFHKSIQEYLTAYFIDLKKLNIDIIQKIFAHKLRFYEEFEEVIIYLTNIEPNFFKYFVDFDPFIFRRHPSLMEKQQEKLLLSVIDKLKNKEQMIYGRWKYLNGSTIVTYKKIKKLDSFLNENIKTHDIKKPIFSFMMGLLKYNYSEEMENYIFNILKSIENKRNYIIDNFLDKYTFNIRLFEFMDKYNLLYWDENEAYFISFEVHLFQSLYGINYRYNNDTEVNYTNISFDKIIVLFDYISSDQLEYITPYLKYEDLFVLLNKIEKTKDDYEEYVLWIIYGILLKYKSKNDLIHIIEFLERKEVYLHSIDTEKMILNFSTFAEDFWDIYFSNTIKDSLYIQALLKLLNISLLDIKKIAHKYPIKDNIEKYINFIIILDIDDYLMDNKVFKKYWNNLQKKQQLERDSSYKKIEKDNLNKYKNLIQNFSTRADLYNMVNYAKYYYKDDFINKFKLDLDDRYSQFIEKAKQEFNKDDSYLKIKNELTPHSLCYSTILYEGLFNLLSIEEINKLVSKKEDYQKLFWHLYKYYKLDKQYFIDLSKLFVDELTSLSIDFIILSLQQGNNKRIGNFYQIKKLLKSLKLFNKVSLLPLIKYLSTIDINSYKILNDNSHRDNLLSILALDKEQYPFIKKLMLNDLDNIYDYLKILLQIDTNKAIEDFYFIYKNIPRYITFSDKAKKYNILKPITFDSYNKPHIEPNKINMFIKYILALKNNRNEISERLESKDIKMILIDYYDFFKEYKRPTNFYFGGDYHSLYNYIHLNGLWNYIETTTKHITLLEELSDCKIESLSIHSKYTLEKAYNLQFKNREFNNKYYKKILDNYKSPNSIFFDYNKLRDDLIEISRLETLNRNAIFKDSEDEINDRFRNALINREYKNTTDQSRGGESESGKNAGERDLVIRNSKGIDESIIEAFILKSLDTNVINKHYEKLVKRYDTVGNNVNFVLVYSKTKNFDNLWTKYIKYDEFENFIDTKDKYSQKSNVRVGISKYKNMKIYHIFINFYSHNKKTGNHQ